MRKGSLAIDVAAFNHHDAIAALLEAADLPVPGDADVPVHMLAAFESGRTVGCAGWERYGSAALLRSVAVAPDRHGRGIGRRLVAAVCAALWRDGVKEVFLLTKGAEGFFGRLGFQVVARADVPPALQDSSSFQGDCCATATAMRLNRPE
jgi:amino-acid N-acetyltransferase